MLGSMVASVAGVINAAEIVALWLATAGPASAVGIMLSNNEEHCTPTSHSM